MINFEKIRIKKIAKEKFLNINGSLGRELGRIKKISFSLPKGKLVESTTNLTNERINFFVNLPYAYEDALHDSLVLNILLEFETGEKLASMLLLDDFKEFLKISSEDLQEELEFESKLNKNLSFHNLINPKSRIALVISSKLAELDLYKVLIKLSEKELAFSEFYFLIDHIKPANRAFLEINDFFKCYYLSSKANENKLISCKYALNIKGLLGCEELDFLKRECELAEKDSLVMKGKNCENYEWGEAEPLTARSNFEDFICL